MEASSAGVELVLHCASACGIPRSICTSRCLALFVEKQGSPHRSWIFDDSFEALRTLASSPKSMPAVAIAEGHISPPAKLGDEKRYLV
jgi:hypothetical protein